jgi:hypothetical protein
MIVHWGVQPGVIVLRILHRRKRMTLHAFNRFVCFATLVLSTSVAAQQLSAPVPQKATIVGTVLDTNGGVVPNARVVLEGPPSTDPESAVTSGNGFFQLVALNPGVPYHAVVSAPGFADWSSQEIILQPGQYFILPKVSLRLSTVQITVAALTQRQIATRQLRAEETQRAFGFIPNFYVSYDKNPAPLTAGMKFQLAFRSLIDPVTMAGFVLNASLYQMAGYPSYGGGVEGYGQRLGATFAGGYTKIMIGDAMLSSLLHQDPRYFYQGTGSTRSRWLHAIANPFVARGDDGRREINFSEIGGDLASGAIANTYYPESERGVGLFARSALIGIGGSMANGILQEFVLRKFTSRSRRRSRSSAAANP